jgi:hypothetical protein
MGNSLARFVQIDFSNVLVGEIEVVEAVLVVPRTGGNDVTA